MLQIVCVKVKPAYSAEYVNALYRACKKHVTQPFRFICLTDDPSGHDNEIDNFILEQKDVLKGWWNKLYLFERHLFQGRILYFDLDTIILKNIDDLANFDFDFGILRDFYFGRVKNKYGSGIMAWQAEKFHHIWDAYEKAGMPQDIAGGDQVFIEAHLENPTILQDKFPQIHSFKVERFHINAPNHSRIVCFHGKPKPHELNQQWVKENWNGRT